MKKVKIKENKHQKNLLAGAFILMVSGLICKFIGAFYRVPLSNILGAEGIGVYQLVFPVFSLFLVLISGGVSTTLSKLVAECRAAAEIKRAKRFLFIAAIYLLIFSSIVGVLFLFFGGQLANAQGNIMAAKGYVAVSLIIVFASVLSAFRGYFQGYQVMYPTAVSQIIEQVLKLVLGLLLAKSFVARGISYGVFGALLGIAIGEFIALIYLAITFLIKRPKLEIIEPETTNKLHSDIAIFLTKNLPITLNSAILPLILALDSFLVVNLLTLQGISQAQSTALFGVYSGMVNSLINFPTVISLAISISIIPSLAFQNKKGAKNSFAISTCFKLVLFISMPCILVFGLFAGNIISILYPATSGQLLKVATLLLRISAINILFISILQVSTGILQALNKSYAALFNLLIAGGVKLILTVLLVNSAMGIYGACFASIMCYFLSSGLNLISLKSVGVKLAAKSSVNILFAAGISLGAMVGIYNLFTLVCNFNLSFVLALFAAMLVYFFAAIFLQVFTKEELEYVPYGNKIKLFIKKHKFN